MIIYICGMIYYFGISHIYLGTNIGLWSLFLYCFLLVIPGDLVLCVLCSFLAVELDPDIKKKKVRIMDLKVIKEKVIQGYLISKNEALEIYEYKDLNQLLEFADKIRTYFCGNGFDICTIINAKSGRCSENCKFCAQSSFYKQKSKAIHY